MGKGFRTGLCMGDYAMKKIQLQVWQDCVLKDGTSHYVAPRTIEAVFDHRDRTGVVVGAIMDQFLQVHDYLKARKRLAFKLSHEVRFKVMYKDETIFKGGHLSDEVEVGVKIGGAEKHRDKRLAAFLCDYLVAIIDAQENANRKGRTNVYDYSTGEVLRETMQEKRRKVCETKFMELINAN